MSFPVTEWCHAAQPPLATCIPNRVTSVTRQKKKVINHHPSILQVQHNLSVTPKAARFVSSARFSQKIPLQLSYVWCKKNAFFPLCCKDFSATDANTLGERDSCGLFIGVLSFLFRYCYFCLYFFCLLFVRCSS